MRQVHRAKESCLQHSRLNVSPARYWRDADQSSMGWVFYQYDDDLRQFGAGMAASDTAEYFPGLSVVYMRLAWSFTWEKERD